jgi:integrase/recombinase XerC
MSKKTSTLKIIPRRPGTLSPARVSIVDSFLAGRSPRTVEAYRQDLVDFTRYIGAKDTEEAVRLLLSHGRGRANETAYAYRADLLARGLSPSTVNRRLAALRSVVKLSRLFGLTDFDLDVEGVKSQPYRDTRGPALEQVRRLLGQLATRKDPKGLRDYALARLLYDLGLRRGEAVALDLADVDLEAGTISVLGKGRTEREALTLPEPTKGALEAWVLVRGAEAGALFTNFDRAGKGGRLSGRSVARVLSALGDKVGLVVRPHGLRHSAITTALDLTGGNVRSVQKFSRHRDLRVLLRYDDNRQNLAAEVARLVAGGV